MAKKNITPEYINEVKSVKRTVLSLSDEWETPQELYDYLCETYEIYPKEDVAATKENKKCDNYFTEDYSAIDGIWYKDVWCNPPHSKNEAFVRKAYEQWKLHNINIMMILPANTVSSQYWHDCIEGIAEYHPIKGRIRFLRDGKPSEYPSRNAYVVVIWRANA